MTLGLPHSKQWYAQNFVERYVSANSFPGFYFDKKRHISGGTSSRNKKTL